MGELGIEFRPEHLAALLILQQGLAAFAIGIQGEHELPVRFLPPGFQGKLASGVALGRCVIACRVESGR